MLVCMFANGNSTCYQANTDLNYNPHSFSLIEILFTINIIILVVAKYMFAFLVSNRFKRSEDAVITPKDFTIMIKLPFNRKGITNDDDLMTACDAYINNDPSGEQRKIPILKVNPVYYIGEYSDLMTQLLKLQKNIRIGTKKGENVDKLVKNKQKLQAEFQILQNEFQNKKYSKFTGWVFVTFNSFFDTEDVLNRNGWFQRFNCCKKELNFSRAPEADDIMWQNWGVPYRKRIIRRLLSWVLIYVIIALNFLSLVGIKYGQHYIVIRNNVTGFLLALTNICFTLVIIIVNAILMLLIQYLVVYQTYRTKTSHFSEIVNKSLLASFGNGVILVLIVNKFVLGDDTWNIFGSDGTMGNMIISMIIYIFSDSLALLLDVGFVFKLFNRWKINKELQKSTNHLLQCELNEAMEQLPISVDDMYQLCFKTIILSFFYQAVLPFGLLLGTIELIGKYFVFKYILSTRSNKPMDLDLAFTLNMIRNFEFSVFIMCAGFLLFSSILSSDNLLTHPLCYVILLIGLFEWLVGIQIITKYLKQSTYAADDIKYSDYEQIFNLDYARLNPITQKEAFKNFMKDLKVIEDQNDKKLEGFLQDFAEFKGVDHYTVHLQNTNIGGTQRLYNEDLTSAIQNEDVANKRPEEALEQINLYSVQMQNIEGKKYKNSGVSDEYKLLTEDVEKNEAIISHKDLSKPISPAFLDEFMKSYVKKAYEKQETGQINSTSVQMKSKKDFEISERYMLENELEKKDPNTKSWFE